jgi:hypothetical protein
MEESVLKLPCDAKGKPDVEAMERDIKALPYADRIDEKKE